MGEGVAHGPPSPVYSNKHVLLLPLPLPGLRFGLNPSLQVDTPGGRAVDKGDKGWALGCQQACTDSVSLYIMYRRTDFLPLLNSLTFLDVPFQLQTPSPPGEAPPLGDPLAPLVSSVKTRPMQRTDTFGDRKTTMPPPLQP